MPYTVPATSKTPALIIYLLDVSGSMGEDLGGKPKIEVVSDALHQVAVRMVQRSTKGTTVAPRYRIAMYAYSSQVTDLLGSIKTVAELAQMGVPRLQPMDATDTAAAFREAERLLKAELGNLQDRPADLPHDGRRVQSGRRPRAYCAAHHAEVRPRWRGVDREHLRH